MQRIAHSLLLLLFILTPNVACSGDKEQSTASTATSAAPPAEIVLTNAYVYTVDANRSIAQAVAIRGNRIIYVGDKKGVSNLISDKTEVHDLGGRMLMPGLHDMHIHAAGIVDLDMCDFKGQPLSLAGIVPFLQACIEKYQIPKGEWLVVLQWPFSRGNQPSERLPTLRAALDDASDKHPIIMMGDDGHHAAVNSLALAKAKDKQGKVVGISKDSIDTVFAEYREMIGVDENGEPNGGLSENARMLVRENFNSDIQGLWAPPESMIPGVAKKLAASGVTSIQDTWVDTALAEYYAWLAESGQMTFRLRTALFQPAVNSHRSEGLAQIPQHVDLFNNKRKKLKKYPLIQPNGVKLFADAVLEGNPYAQPPTLPVAAVLGEFKQPIFAIGTEAEMIEVTGYVDLDGDLCESVRSQSSHYGKADVVNKFLDEHGYHPAQCTKASGVLEHSEAFICEYVRQMTEAGFHVHIHALSDKGVRVATDAFAVVKHTADSKGLTQSITHVQLAHPDDVKRLGELGIYVAFTYVWAIPGLEYDAMVIPFIDEVKDIADMYNPEHYYMQNVYPVKSVMDAGGILTWGSDAPVGSRNPLAFPSMQAAVTREAEGKVMNAGQRISIHDAIAAYTINGARLMTHENKLGSIEVGKTADLIVLNQNVVHLSEQGKADRIAETLVDMTIFDGKVVFVRK